MNTLPTYKEAVKGFIPPPSYHDIITPDVIPYEYHLFYRTDKLEFKDIDEVVDIYDEDIIEYFSIGQHERDSNFQHIESDQMIKDEFESLYLILKEKLVQIDRNIQFVDKKVRSRNQENYCIEQLRRNTIADFQKIYKRVAIELQTIHNLCNRYIHFNNELLKTSQELQLLSEKLDSLFHTNTYCTASSKSQTQKVTHQLYCHHNKLNKIIYNISLIDQQITKFSNTDDVSYVLKERARVYNDARQIIINQHNIE